jgi:cbb3-type cytochrome oxidase subunit 3
MDWFHFAMAVRPFFMVWIVVLMAGILFAFCRPRRRRELDEHSRIPFNDDQPAR